MDMDGMVAYLASDGEPVRGIHALDDASDVLHRGHQRRELVVLEVCETRDDACGYDEDIYREGCENPDEGRTRSGEV